MHEDKSTTRRGIVRSNVSTPETAADSGHPVDGHPPPGHPPYTRGIHKEMYRNKRWTMRQYAGFSTAKETNQRFKLLLNSGQTGLSVAFDLPTQLGLDSDHETSEGEVGKVGVAIDTLDDMRELFDGIDLGEVSTSMTINASATTLLALYVALADEKGIPRSKLKGTVQNDILKEYIARGLYVYPPKESIRLTTDLFQWCHENLPSWNTISVSGYHMREAGCTAVEEVGLTISNALYYAEEAIKVGMNIDDFAPRMSFFFGCHNDFLEEISKFRAARQIWFEQITKRFSPQNSRSQKLRFHTQTAGVTLTAQQPMNNAIRVAYQALSSVFGGTQSLHTNSFDEAIGLPTDKAVKIALRTQQIISDEIFVADTVDPWAGSYLIEELTAKIVTGANELINEIYLSGGAMDAIKSGVQQKKIHESAWRELKKIESGELPVIGVNKYVEDAEDSTLGLRLEKNKSDSQILKIKKIKESRNNDSVVESLSQLRIACNSDQNVMEPLIIALKLGATVGEVNGIMREEFGTWVSPSGV